MRNKKLFRKFRVSIFILLILLIVSYIFVYPIRGSYTKTNFTTITSKYSGITFKTPWDYSSSYQNVNIDGRHTETLEYFKPVKYAYKLIITISDNVSADDCKEDSSVSYTPSYTEKILAGTFPLQFHQSGGNGWLDSRAHYYLEDKKSCIQIYKNEADSEIVHYFDQILESAEYDLPWWRRFN